MHRRKPATSSTITSAESRIGSRVGARQRRKRRIDLDQDQIDAGDAPGDRKPGGADAGAEIDDAIAATRRRRGGEQHGVVAGAVTRFQLPQTAIARRGTHPR